MRVCQAVILTVVVVLGIAVNVAMAQPPQTGAPPRPVIKSAVDLVPVDVNVVDKSGRPVPGLTVSDFALTIDGRTRTLASAEFVAVPPKATPGDSADYSSNAGVAGGRLIVLAVDAGSIGAGRGKSALTAAARFLDQLNPADRVALVTLPGAGPQIDFTSNRRLVQSLVQKIAGQAGQNEMTRRIGLGEALAIERGEDTVIAQVVEQHCTGDSTPQGRDSCLQQLTQEANLLLSDTRERSRASVAALKSLFDRLGTSETPKTIVLISEGLLLEPDFGDVAWIGPRSSAAHVALYVLQIDTPDVDLGNRRSAATRNQDREVLREGLDVMAGMARGDVFRIVANADFAFQRLATELSAYYLLSFEALAGDRDEKPHKIKIDVRKRDVEVRARREFSVAAAAAAATRDELVEALRAPLLAADIPLSLTTYSFRDTESSKIKIIVAASIDRSVNPDVDLAVGYVLIDDKGKVAVSQAERRLTTTVSPQSRQQKYLGAAIAAPGTYTLRLAAVDANGRRGSVERTISADTKTIGAIHVTDLLIADNSEPQGAGLSPTVDATFTGDELQAYLELFGDADALKGALVDIELAADGGTRLLNAVSAPLQAADGNDGRRVAQAGLPIGPLAPGDYVARAVVSVDGRPAGNVSRSFRITRAPKTMVSAPAAAPAVKPSATPTAPSRGEAFDRTLVLRSPVLGFFLDQLKGTKVAASITPAVEDVRGGKFEEAASILDKSGDDQLAAAFLKGLVLLSKGELDPAANKFRDALRIDSEFYPATFYLGACYAAGGRDREAAGAWQTSLVAEWSVPFVYTMLGDALLRLQDADMAIEILTEARTRWPDDEQVAARLASAVAMKTQRDKKR